MLQGETKGIIFQSEEEEAWQELISETKALARVSLSYASQNHLQKVLISYTHADDDPEKSLFNIDLIRKYHEVSLIDEKSIRSVHFEYVGDECLLMCGLFFGKYERLNRHNPSLAYIEEIGQTAFMNVFHEKQHPYFFEISESFKKMVRVLRHMEQRKRSRITGLIKNST